jgi:hypothetical protein
MDHFARGEDAASVSFPLSSLKVFTSSDLVRYVAEYM